MIEQEAENCKHTPDELHLPCPPLHWKQNSVMWQANHIILTYFAWSTPISCEPKVGELPAETSIDFIAVKTMLQKTKSKKNRKKNWHYSRNGNSGEVFVGLRARRRGGIVFGDHTSNHQHICKQGSNQYIQSFFLSGSRFLNDFAIPQR